MVSSSDALSVLKPVVDGVSTFVGWVFLGLNYLFFPIEWLFMTVLNLTQRGMMFQWAIDFVLALGAILFVFLTQTGQVGLGGDLDYVVAEHVARSGIFVSSLGLLLVTLSGMLGKLLP